MIHVLWWDLWYLLGYISLTSLSLSKDASLLHEVGFMVHYWKSQESEEIRMRELKLLGANIISGNELWRMSFKKQNFLERKMLYLLLGIG